MADLRPMALLRRALSRLWRPRHQQLPESPPPQVPPRQQEYRRAMEARRQIQWELDQLDAQVESFRRGEWKGHRD